MQHLDKTHLEFLLQYYGYRSPFHRILTISNDYVWWMTFNEANNRWRSTLVTHQHFPNDIRCSDVPDYLVSRHRGINHE